MTTTHSHRVIVVGSSFAGLTAALELRKHLPASDEIVVLDPRDHFTFIPSLIWLPFGMRSPDDVTFKLGPMYAKQGIRFVNEAATGIDLDGRTVTTSGGETLAYDRLFLGTGPRLAFEKIPGLGPHDGYTQSVCNLDHALIARDAWDRFLEHPGPVVVGTAQGGSCFGASYEFLLNLRHRIKKAGLDDVAPVTFVTAEPYIGHFGLGGVGNSAEKLEALLAKQGIEGLPNTVIKEVRDGEMELEGGRILPFAYAMIVPPFTGVDVVRETEGLGNPMGFIPVTEEYRHPDHPEVFAAGVDVAIPPPGETPVPAGVPKTGQMSEVMAKVAAQNIAADLGHGEHRTMALSELQAICILDAGNGGVIFKADNVLSDDATARVIAGPQAHWAKIAFERIFLGSRKRGKLVL